MYDCSFTFVQSQAEGSGEAEADGGFGEGEGVRARAGKDLSRRDCGGVAPSMDVNSASVKSARPFMPNSKSLF